MKVIRQAVVVAAVTMALALPAVALAKAAQPPQQPPADFVPVDNAPPGEQIPAMPLLGAAYGFMWVGMLGYVFTLARRLQKVEAEITDLESRRK